MNNVVTETAMEISTVEYNIKKILERGVDNDINQLLLLCEAMQLIGDGWLIINEDFREEYVSQEVQNVLETFEGLPDWVEPNYNKADQEMFDNATFGHINGVGYYVL